MDSGVFSVPLDAHGSASTLNPSGGKLPLREFIAGVENRHLRVAADAFVARNQQFNPLVLVGPSGSGKTLLARGLIRQWKTRNPELKSIATTGADFARAFASAVDDDAMDDFHERFREVELLFIDDVGQLAGKDAAQRELAATIDRLLSFNSQILMTLHSLPVAAQALSAPLASRLSSGLVATHAPPAYDTRREILKQLAATHKIALADDCLNALAEGLEVSVPQLNAAVLQLIARSESAGRSIDKVMTQEYLAEQAAARQPSLRNIAVRVSRYFDLKMSELKSPTRRQAVVQARGIAMYLARELTGKSLEQVGRHFGGRDHTTVLHAYRKTASLLERDPSIRQTVTDLLEQLTA